MSPEDLEGGYVNGPGDRKLEYLKMELMASTELNPQLLLGIVAAISIPH